MGQRQHPPQKNNWEQASLTHIHRESSQRVRPRLPALWPARRCLRRLQMQHLDTRAQVAVRQRALEDNLWHLGKVKAETILRPIEGGPPRATATAPRLAVRHVIKKGAVLVGFHERKSRYVADMEVCPVLPPHVSAMLMPLRKLVADMDARDTCPQLSWPAATTSRPWCCATWSPCRPKTLPACAPLPPSTTCNGGCSPRGRHREVAG